jgi:hypothetical protein
MPEIRHIAHESGFHGKLCPQRKTRWQRRARPDSSSRCFEPVEAAAVGRWKSYLILQIREI